MNDRLARARDALRHSKLPSLAAALLTLLLAIPITIAITDDGDVTIRVGATRTVVDTTAPATPAQVAKAPPAGELQSDPGDVAALRDSTPDGVPAEKLEAAEQTADQYAEDHGVEEADAPIAQGGAQGYTCRKSYQAQGYGAFRSYFSMFVLHYTVSPNSAGWGDVYSIKNYLNSVGLSATFVIDFEGHCLQTVPLDRNPYTQGGFNSYGVSVEIIATGKETRGDWLASPLFRQGILAALVRDVLKSHNLPVRFVDPVGCTPKAGYTDHNHLECGNNHVDVSPNFPFDVFAGQVKAAPKPVCGKRCHRAKVLRGKHQRTHARFRKRDCRHKRKPENGYCRKLRNRNKAVHLAAKRERISLKGTYR